MCSLAKSLRTDGTWNRELFKYGTFGNSDSQLDGAYVSTLSNAISLSASSHSIQSFAQLFLTLLAMSRRCAVQQSGQSSEEKKPTAERKQAGLFELNKR